jgi:hypothetical protein
MKIIITESRLSKVIVKWLDNEYGNLTQVVRGKMVSYVDQDGLPILIYYRNKNNNGGVYVNFQKVWELLGIIFGMNRQQIQVMLKIWLEETYNIKGYTPVNSILLLNSFGTGL